MRILITNDDGIGASGLIPLVQWAQKLGEVTVYAPKVEQSGKSHGIELRKAFEVKEVDLCPGVRAYAVDSTPADCLRYAVLGRKEQFDLVISGINKGFNIGCDILYSGTVAAVFEAACLGLKAVALSTSPEYYGHAAQQLDTVYDAFVKYDLLSKNGIYNINIPADPKGIRFTRQGGPYFSDDFEPIGNDLYMPKGICVYKDGGGTELDTDATLKGFISIMPLTISRAAENVLAELNISE